MKLTTVYEIADDIKDRFGIDPDFYVLIKHCVDALKHTRLGALQRKIEKFTVDNYQVEMPCNTIWVHSVFDIRELDSLRAEDGITLPLSPFGNNSEAFLASEYTEIKGNQTAMTKGTWVNHIWRDPYVDFNVTGVDVWVEYIQTAVDENGFPLIPKVAEEACQYNYVYYHYLPQFMAGKMDGNRFSFIKEERRKKLAQAVNLKGISRNKMSKILNSLSTFDRKTYNIDV